MRTFHLEASLLEGDQVRLTIGWSYHGSLESFCDGVLERSQETSGKKQILFDGDLGQESMVCKCGKWYTWEEGMEDATGKECDPKESFFGSCPEGNMCYCHLECLPFHDFPCNGSYVYSFSSRGFEQLYPENVIHDDIVVDWTEECGVGGSNADVKGCASTGMRPHLVMLILFALGAAVPLLLRRGRR